MIASKNWVSVFVSVANRSFLLSVCTIWKTKPTLIQVNRRIKRNEIIIRTKQLHCMKERIKKSKCDINPTQTPQTGLRRIARKQNVSTLGNLQCSFCEERKHLSRSMKLIRSTFSLKIIAITGNIFSCSDRALNSQGLKSTSRIWKSVVIGLRKLRLVFSRRAWGRNAWRRP